MRIYDPRLGRFLSVDPLAIKYPYYTPYQFAGNTPIIAIDLDGEEPKVIITNQITGYTKINVYGDGNVKEAVVATYKAIVQYTDSKGKITTIAQFNVTRDGWYDMGTDEKGNTILSNRSSDPADSKKIFIALNYKQKYGKETPAFGLTPIKSPIDSKYNKTFFKNGKPSDPLDPETVRSTTANGAQIHVGGYYEHPDGEVSLGGTYGCYGIVDPSQISKTSDASKDDPNTVTLSNDEIRRFGKAVKSGNAMQVKEHGVSEKTEVEIQKRDYPKVKTVPAGSATPVL
jgi:hypothetical protein